MKNKIYIPVLLLVGISLLAGCKTKGGVGKFFKAVAEATEPEYYWTRRKVAEKAETSSVSPEKDPEAWLSTARAEPIETLMPFEMARVIPKEYVFRLDSFREIDPSAFQRFTIIKSENGDWNRELFFSVNEEEVVTLEVEGPKKVMVLSMVGINRDMALDNMRKYIYACEDETGKIREVPSYIYRRNDLLFEHTESESGSTPHIFPLNVPEGKHTYSFHYKYSDGGDILLKFFEVVYPWPIIDRAK